MSARQEFPPTAAPGYGTFEMPTDRYEAMCDRIDTLTAAGRIVKWLKNAVNAQPYDAEFVAAVSAAGDIYNPDEDWVQDLAYRINGYFKERDNARVERDTLTAENAELRTYGVRIVHHSSSESATELRSLRAALVKWGRFNTWTDPVSRNLEAIIPTDCWGLPREEGKQQ